jgi:hypothetical protein
MESDQPRLEQLVLKRMIRLNANVHGIVFGILLGLGIFIATNWLVLKGGPVAPNGEVIVGPHLALLNQFFIGYTVTFGGSLVGFAYGLLSGYVIGFVIAQTYNWIIDLKEHRAKANGQGSHTGAGARPQRNTTQAKPKHREAGHSR